MTNGERWTIHHGDCLNAIKLLDIKGISAVVTDPPFGMNWDTNGTRFSCSHGQSKTGPRPIHNDDKPFDPSPWLDFPEVVLWGSNHFAQRLPVGTTLVFAKKNEMALGKFLSDCEIGWQKGGHGCYLFAHVWNGVARDSEQGEHYHPTQKPVCLMEWILRRLNLPKGAIVLDPYAGSFTTGIACLRLGLHFVGIEQDADYCAIGEKRLLKESNQPRFEFAESATAPTHRQEAMPL